MTEQRDTYHSRAMTDADAPGGRFAAITKSAVSGKSPTVEYPRQPAGPWGYGPRVPDEAPLGYSVSDLEPVGEAHEIAASLVSSAVTDPSPLTPLSGEALGGDRSADHPQQSGLRSFRKWRVL